MSKRRLSPVPSPESISKFLLSSVAGTGITWNSHPKNLVSMERRPKPTHFSLLGRGRRIGVMAVMRLGFPRRIGVMAVMRLGFRYGERLSISRGNVVSARVFGFLKDEMDVGMILSSFLVLGQYYLPEAWIPDWLIMGSLTSNEERSLERMSSSFLSFRTIKNNCNCLLKLKKHLEQLLFVLKEQLWLSVDTS